MNLSKFEFKRKTPPLMACLLCGMLCPSMRAQQAAAAVDASSSAAPPSDSSTSSASASDGSSSPPPPSSSSSSSSSSLSGTAADQVTKMQKFTVTDVPVSEQILPTARPVGSVFGDDLNILDTPRSVSSVNQAWMTDRQVKNTMDFSQFAPGVYSPANYGVPAIPQIRGDEAQVYVDGQILPYTFTSVLPSFNGVEAMDIVKGPGSAVYGPQGTGPGGYVNLVTKEPYFEGERTEVTASWGGWASGHSYSNPSFTIDNGGPITDKLAYRVSYHSEYGDGYYLNEKDNDQDLFVALTYLFSSSLKLQWWAQGYAMRFNEESGVNRVSQAFIWDGSYIGGPATSLYDYAGIFSLVDPAATHVVKLPDDVTIQSPSDSNRAKRFESQLVATLTLSPDSQLINRTLFQFCDSRQFQNYGYDEFMPVNQTIQDRLEYHRDFTLGGIQQSLIAGGDFRYARLIAYQDYSLQPFFYYDLTAPANTFQIPGYSTYLNYTVGSGYAIPGFPGYSGMATGSTGNQDSFIYDSAAFVQDRIKLLGSLSAFVGLRLDYISATTRSPALIDTFSSTFEPMGTFYDTSANVSDPSYFASLVYKLTDTSSLYATFDEVDAVLGSSNFGGVAVAAGNGDPYSQLKTSLQTKSKLYEAGYKQSLLGNQLYMAFDVFQQDKVEPQLTGPALQVKSEGVELDMVYQPSRALSINVNATYQNVTDFGSFFYEQTNNYRDGFPSSIIVDGQPGNGVGSPDFGGYSPPNGRIRAPGVPTVMANFFVEYKLESGFGAGIGPKIFGRQNADDEGAIHIPGEYELDGYIFYRQKTWDVQVNVNNITNQRILDTIDVTYAGNDQIYVREPINASITYRYRW
jgi:outer membrane receptor protein involved in Fe transport